MHRYSPDEKLSKLFPLLTHFKTIFSPIMQAPVSYPKNRRGKEVQLFKFPESLFAQEITASNFSWVGWVRICNKLKRHVMFNFFSRKFQNAIKSPRPFPIQTYPFSCFYFRPFYRVRNALLQSHNLEEKKLDWGN